MGKEKKKVLSHSVRRLLLQNLSRIGTQFSLTIAVFVSAQVEQQNLWKLNRYT